VVPGPAGCPPDLDHRIATRLQSLDASMSTYKPDSELNRLNRQPVGEPFAVSPDLLRVLMLSKQAFQITQGAFDPTVGPLVDLWGFGPVDTGDRVPSESELKEALESIGLDYLAIDESASSVLKTRYIEVDLSGIVPGYAADQVSELLDSLGLKNYLVDLGGELRGSGQNGKGKVWQIGIEVPSVERTGVERVLALRDVGVATSGDYRNYFERDGVHYSHIIDPASGRPVSNGVASATVITPTAAEADALSTGFMVLGKDAGLKIADERGIALLLLVKEGAGFV
jgi:thiamine biosynthesis lipoprotein